MGDRPSPKLLQAPSLKTAVGSFKGSGRLSVTGDIRGSTTGDGDESGKVVYINPSSLAGGGIAEKAAAIFRLYDTEGKGELDHEAMMSALAELGVLNGLTVKKLTEILSIGNEAGSKGRTYSLQEFVSFYERLAHYQAKAARQERIKALSKMPGIPEGAESNELLKRVYVNYCRYTVGQGRLTFDEADPKMSSTQFVKLCQDLGLVQPNGPLNVVTVDVIFHKCKPVGQRRLVFPSYLKALCAAAEESNMNVFELIGVLGLQIEPSKVFVAPQPVIFRQEVRSMEQSKFRLPDEPQPDVPETTTAEEPPASVRRKAKPAQESIVEVSEDEEEPKPKPKPRDAPSARPAAKKAFAEAPVAAQPPPSYPNTRAPTLYGHGRGKPVALPPDAPQWVVEVVGKVGALEEQLDAVNKENEALKAQVNKGGLIADDVVGSGNASMDAALAARIAALERTLQEENTPVMERFKGEMKEDMKKVAKAAVKTLPSLEARVTACEQREAVLEQGAADVAAKVATVEGRVKALSENLDQEVQVALAGSVGKSVVPEIARMMQPGGELAKALETQIAASQPRLDSLEKATIGYSARLKNCEDGLALSASKAEQALTMAQDGMQRAVAMAPKLASLEAAGENWSSAASGLEAAVRELQRQVKELYGKNAALEAEVANLKGGQGNQQGLVAEANVRAEPGGSGGAILVGGERKAQVVAMAEIASRLADVEGGFNDLRAGVKTALAATGLTPEEAARDGATMQAASKRAAHDAMIADLSNRMSSVEAKAQEAVVAAKKAEAMVGGPAAGLAAMGAANAAAANAAAAARKGGADAEVVQDLAARVAAVEARQNQVNANLATVSAAANALPALEAAVTHKVPELESALRSHDNAHKQLAAKVGELEAMLGASQHKVPEVEALAKVVEGRVGELERKAASADRIMREVSDAVKSLSAEQDGLAAAAAINAKLGKNGGGGAAGGAPDASVVNLVMGTEERLQRAIQSVRDSLSNTSADLDGAKSKYDQTLQLVTVNFEALHKRLAAMEGGGGGGGGGSGLSPYAKVGELKDLENHMIDRLRLQADVCDKMQRTINQLVGDVERVAGAHNTSEQARAAQGAANNRSLVRSESLGLLESKIESRFQLLATQFVTIEALREWEMRFATLDAVRGAQDKARANDEVILGAVKELDKRFHDKMEVKEQVLLRMARQVDFLQNAVRNVSSMPSDGGAPQIKIITPGGMSQPLSAGPGGAMHPLPIGRSEPGQDPLSILLAQAGAGAPPPS
uniref:EF-hand domain-containing protein n=1 Tax=Chlamydomonas leiostraca TaxID=1034604 RepID=A0A7S0S286_9CHLO|mmetsp:Transcript_5527/g.13707  ORF Transcript_5527/g.13707 Transcript_5527/m.13707 type:complete len:1265 (+) Transcript_5527:124-3918(+)|eukprot:CAMPEP_0202863412 /NCGR_PEP_ID=MMETSP1391-20130828/4064_1 /ASSEMBLY_ACC=CAM_ASM_000867 /TAXON_ID=1034604 /ORGANISM="Chlamydomonas leiostraca, Strain SAG 11-49" /LENGTH=1264 /DNA_ID=CAMNT_0049543049 /DNA_START=124 /DNA_END=3918 /DNA_ORIENTATION=-